jgi:hypothetical protein
MLVSGVAMFTAAFPALAQQGQPPAPAQDHSGHHGGTDQQTGQQMPGGGMMGGMMGQGGQGGMMGQGMQGGGMMGGGCPMMRGMMGSGQQGMGQGMMGGGCPMMRGMMGSGQQGMMGPGMMQGGMGPGMGGMFGSHVTPMMNLSVEDVRSYLTVQLDRLNNKRLKIGDITSDDGTVTADIVTIDNSLVQRLKVDRHTGTIEYEN